MLKYFKWEMIHELKKLKGALITLFITFLIIMISDLNSSATQLFVILFVIEMYILLFAAVYYGGKRTIDTYNKKTFLLESMIPISAKKLLLVKYLIATILSFGCCILLFVGLAIVGGKIDIDFFTTLMKQLLGNEDFYSILFKAFMLYTSFSIFVTSLMTASFVSLKSIFPSMKRVKGLSYIVTYISAYIFFQIVAPIIDGGVLAATLVFLIGSVGCYFITVLFVENKLEVYN